MSSHEFSTNILDDTTDTESVAVSANALVEISTKDSANDSSIKAKTANKKSFSMAESSAAVVKTDPKGTVLEANKSRAGTRSDSKSIDESFASLRIGPSGIEALPTFRAAKTENATKNSFSKPESSAAVTEASMVETPVESTADTKPMTWVDPKNPANFIPPGWMSREEYDKKKENS